MPPNYPMRRIQLIIGPIAICQLAKTARVESCRERDVPLSDFLDLVRPRYGEQKSAVFKGFDIMSNRPFQRQ